MSGKNFEYGEKERKLRSNSVVNLQAEPSKLPKNLENQETIDRKGSINIFAELTVIFDDFLFWKSNKNEWRL